MRLYENGALIQAHIQTLSFFSSSSFCGEMVTEEPNLIVSHENNMLQLYYTQWSWNCRGCWHQSCLQLPLTKKLKFYLFQITRHGCTVLLFLTPPCVKINLGNLHACRLPVIDTQFFLCGQRLFPCWAKIKGAENHC